MRNARNVAGSTSYLMLLLAAAGVGCADQTTGSPQGGNDSVMSLAAALQAAVSDCADAAGRCETQSADAGDARAMCRAEFDTCREAAKAAAKPDIDKAVNPCVDSFKTCREAAGADKQQCAASLQACLGAGERDGGSVGEGQGKPERDAAVADTGKSPVAACIAELHTCIAGDLPARECTEAMRACIAGSAGHNGNSAPGKPADAGRPDHAGNDGGSPDQAGNEDAGKPDQPGRSGEAGKPADQGQDEAGAPVDPGSAGDSKACKEARETCLSGGGERDACARMLKECRM